MREHEIEYPCMPDGIAEMTRAGPRCWFCSSPWPDQDHLNIHLIAQCRESDGRPRNYTRMANLINHVEHFHGASDGRRLAEKWRNTNKNGKKYYACGFCISCYTSLAEQTNHIDVQHWNHGQELKDWQPNNVILGLLLQPNVHDAWNGLVARHNVPRATHFSWHTSIIGDLQQKLEQSRDSAENLARWTFMQSSYYQRHGAEIETSAQSGLLDNACREPRVALTPQMPEKESGTVQTYEPSMGHVRIPPSLPSHPLANHMRYAHANMPNSNMSDYGSNLSGFRYGLSGGPDTPPRPHPGAGGRDISRNPTHPNMDFDNSSDQPWSNTSNAMHADTSFNSHDESFGYDLGIPDAHASNTIYEDWSNWQNIFNQRGYRGMVPTQPAHPAEHQAQAGETLDAAELDRFLSSHLDTSLPISEEVPDRRFAPFSVAVHKRKHSGSTTIGPNTDGEVDVEMDVNTGQRSRYRPGDDHVRRRRRNDFSALYGI